jgi:endonuclease/exonuclease/phosphatase family metal-dependent hydrolase
VSVTLSIRRLLTLTFAAALCTGAASAQTTVTLSSTERHVTDATIGAGSAANTVNNSDRITTRLSTDVNAVRRGLVKFDTENTIPAGSTITSARLTLYVRAGAGTTTRRIGVYPVIKSFYESQVTWVTRKRGYKWSTAGSDIGARVSEMSVPKTAGAAVTVDVTSLVQRAVRSSSSRYTRLALIDIGTKDATSYRQFHSSESSDTRRRPKLVVVYRRASTSAPAPAPTPTNSGGRTSTLKLLNWNTHYGVGTDGRYNLDRIASVIARTNPDIISLNEVTRYAYYGRGEDQIARYAALLKAKTGRTWYYRYRTDNGAARGVGNAVLSRFPIASTSYCQLSGRRVAVNAAVYVNGRLLNVWSTHLDSHQSTGTYRIAEVKALNACMNNFAQQRIVAGDFNARSTATEIGVMERYYYDAWAESAADRTAYSYPGNTSFGATRRSRIDYVFLSKGATALSIRKAEVIDTRDSYGRMPSDHKPLVVTFSIR